MVIKICNDCQKPYFANRRTTKCKDCRQKAKKEKGK